MDDLISNIFRGSVSSVMNVILLFTMTRSKLGNKSTFIIAVSVFFINIVSTLWFYLYGDLTGLSRFDVMLFIIIGLSLKPLTKLNFMQWSFTFLTIMNISMMIIILSFHMSRSLPMPQYAHTILRLVLYLVVLFIFQRFLVPLYQSIVNNWPIFSALVVCVFLNLAYFFFVPDDIHNTLIMYKWPLLLLVTLSLAAYGTVFYSMKRFMEMYALETENLKIQNETGRLYRETMKLERYANYDTLTGLPNRRYFFEKLEKVVAETARVSGKAAILYIDLDAFKDINDTHGHQVGDFVLITVGNRLLDSTQGTDFVARLGGDEFAILLSNIDAVSRVEDLSKSIHKTIQEPMIIDSVECKVNSSIGIAIYPDTGLDSETLVKNADSAMYAVKRDGKGGIALFKNP